MPRYFVGLLILSTLQNSFGVSLYTQDDLLKSSACYINSCKILNTSLNSKSYLIKSKKNNESVLVSVGTYKGVNIAIEVLLNRGSLLYGPSGFEMDVLQGLFKWSVNQKLDIKGDLISGPSLVETNVFSSFVLKKINLDGKSLSVYVASMPDKSTDPKKGRLLYGVVESKNYKVNSPLFKY